MFKAFLKFWRLRTTGCSIQSFFYISSSNPPSTLSSSSFIFQKVTNVVIINSILSIYLLLDLVLYKVCIFSNSVKFHIFFFDEEPHRQPRTSWAAKTVPSFIWSSQRNKKNGGKFAKREPYGLQGETRANYSSRRRG